MHSSTQASNSVEANISTFMEVLEKREDPDLIAVARRIIAWAETNGLVLRWSSRGGVPVFVPAIEAEGGKVYFIEVTAKGRVDLLLNTLAETEQFRSEEMRLEILRRLNLITGLSIPEFTIGKRPNFSLAAIANDTAFGQFTSTFDWVKGQLQR